MALVTLQRSPTPSAASTASTTTTTAGEDFGSDDERRLNQSLSESFFMVKGAALFLQQGSSAQGQKPHTHHKNAGDLPQHLQVMINILRSEDRIKLAVRLESIWSDRVRYMVVVYTSGRQDTEENVLLGMDFSNKDSKCCSIGMVLPLWCDTKIHLDGDGGFSVSTADRTHIFKPVSVQAMWSALQVLHKACEVSRRCNYFPGGVALVWASYYNSCISSDQSCINEWNAMRDLETMRPDSPAMFVDKPTERECTECLVKAKLRSIMMFQDLENVTSKEIRNELEQHMNCNLTEYKEFIDNEMLLILGQMDKATLIFDHVYLGSEWNASNLEELQETGVGYILNVTREIDNFFPGTFCYHNVRVYDEEATDLLAHWNDTYNFIVRAKRNQSKCLVHCKMGVSRSASTVIAYAMKEYNWSLEKAYNFVKQRRSITRPNDSFMRQLAEYEGILDASKQRHNRLWRPDSSCDHPDCQQGAEEIPGDPVNPCDTTTPGGGPCCSSPFQLDPAGPKNHNYYFRRLSDSALDSEPSTPVRGPPLLDTERVFIAIEDVERDALLDDEASEGRGSLPLSHLGAPGEGTAAQTYPRGAEPLEELRLRLEFSTVEEEDEEEAQKEQEEMEALAEGGRRRAGGVKETEGDGSESRNDVGAMNRLGNENSNNNNHLRAPNGPTDHLQKQLVKTRLSPTSLPVTHTSRSPVPEAGEPGLASLPFRTVPAVSVEVPACPSSPVKPTVPALCRACGPFGEVASDWSLGMAGPVPSCSDKHPHLLQARGERTSWQVSEGKGGFRGWDSPGEPCPGSATDGRSGPGWERPAGHAPSQQQQEMLAQLQRSGLVRRRAERLEKLSGLFQPLPAACETLPAGSGGLSPVSSPLTRSSSSDSIRSVRGTLGLVRQRAQEIETRLRLAGLTVPSRLKRSNSLAKLGGLTFSSEDLCSSACSSDAGTLPLLSLSPELEHVTSPDWEQGGSRPGGAPVALFDPGSRS
ncbi:protein phosphatase Slingshot homolog 1 isoform X1 [Brachyhypopomus gauderio]|uniref:protein phosphatase Slingshot homolog 1 isoform X1 n=2 Tax=Brachyhypopomus gauderio TaxID=698409 RepID=UPI004041BE6D